MKIIKLISVLVLLFSMNTLCAFTPDVDPGKSKVVAELTSLLQRPGISSSQHDLQARVYFMLNRANEIVVLEVEAEEAEMEAYIKGRLNYRKLKCKDLKPGMEYMVPVRVKSSI